MVKRTNIRAFAMEMTLSTAYSAGMETIVFVGALALLAVASQVWAADSRPGFGDGRVDRKESTLPH
jgi:hypothetical protein